MQIIVDTNESDDKLKLAVEHALKELEKRTGQEFQVIIKPKGQQSQPQPSQPQSQPQASGSIASKRAEEMESMMGSVDLSIIGNPKKY